jgi:hypothetical protein
VAVVVVVRPTVEARRHSSAAKQSGLDSGSVGGAVKKARGS